LTFHSRLYADWEKSTNCQQTVTCVVWATISFWDIPDAVHWNIRGIVFVNLSQFEVSSG